MKRTFDFFFALLGLVLLLPLFSLVAGLIKANSPGPVFFRQERIGKGFRSFYIYKFRTMQADAPCNGGPLTVDGDPRITPVGRLLRATKIDELPQLINVLRGDMSLVGPRPEVPRYVDLFRKEYEDILGIRPGITDLASLKFCNEASLLADASDPEHEYVTRILPEKILLAKEYLHRSSLWFDLGLILRTLLSLLRNRAHA